VAVGSAAQQASRNITGLGQGCGERILLVEFCE
jgi:hypothetical protein